MNFDYDDRTTKTDDCELWIRTISLFPVQC